MKKLLLIDGNSLFHRAYHALPPLTDKSGEMANAVFGFSNMLLKAINEVGPDYIACAFDTRAPTFRHIEYEKYKAQRKAPPPDLYPQLPKVKKVLDAFGIPYFEKEGYEADDLIATIATKAFQLSVLGGQFSDKSSSVDLLAGKKNRKTEKRKNLNPKTDNREPITVVILSGDRDVLQLVDGNIKVQMPGWNLKETTLYDPQSVVAKYGLEPHQMVDYKSLTGDPSDNVPGISGIGPKTAAQLLQKYHTLENLFKQLDRDPQSLGTLEDKLRAGREAALAAKKLVELDRNVDLKLEIGNLKFEPDWDRVRGEYEDLGFKSIVAKIPGGLDTSEVESGSRLENTSEVSKGSKAKSKTNNSDQLELI